MNNAKKRRKQRNHSLNLDLIHIKEKETPASVKLLSLYTLPPGTSTSNLKQKENIFI